MGLVVALAGVRGAVAVAVAVALVDGVAGLLLAWYLDLPPGPANRGGVGGLFGVVAVGRAVLQRRIGEEREAV